MLLLSKNWKCSFMQNNIQHHSTVTNFSFSFPSMCVFINVQNWKREEKLGVGEGCKEKEEGKARKVRGKEKEERAFVSRKRGAPLPMNTAISLTVTSRSLSSSIFVTLQIPCSFSFVLPRIIECFWILHSSAASCLFLILFPSKEGKYEPNNSLLLLLTNWYLGTFNSLPHKKPTMAIRRVCVCRLSTWVSCLHIVSPSFYLCIYWWEPSKEKYVSISFCWRLSVLGHGLGHISLGEGWWEYM